MSKIIALIYADTHIPAEIYQEVKSLQNEGRLDLLDVTEVEIKDNGKLKFERGMSMPLVGKSDGLFLPALVGLLFFGAGTDNPRIHKVIADLSLNTSFVQRILNESSPRNSILFLYLRSNCSDQTLARIRQHGGNLLQMDLSSFQVEQLERIFHGGHLKEADQTLLNFF